MRFQKEAESAPLQTALSTQQQHVLALLAEGKTNKEIGSSLELSDKTVKNYIRFIFQKLNVTRRAQAAALFTRNSAARHQAGDNRIREILEPARTPFVRGNDTTP
jgi:DNA-binding NarL/FixJ family response regulator